MDQTGFVKRGPEVQIKPGCAGFRERKAESAVAGIRARLVVTPESVEHSG